MSTIIEKITQIEAEVSSNFIFHNIVSFGHKQRLTRTNWAYLSY